MNIKFYINLITNSVISLFVMGQMAAFSNCDCCCNPCQSFNFSPGDYGIVEGAVGLYTGYRQDSYRIRSSISDGIEKYTTKVRWKDIESVPLGFSYRIKTCNNFYSRGYIDYAWILDSDSEVSEYIGNHATRYSKITASSDKGYLFNASVALGIPLCHPCVPDAVVYPLLGASYHRQHLTLRDGKQVVNTDHPELLGPFPGLNSKYRTNWNTLFVGNDIFYNVMNEMFVVTKLEFHWVHYKAYADWNLRDDYVHDIMQTSTGFGTVFGFGIRDTLMCNLVAGLDFNFEWWQAFRGRQRAYYEDESEKSTFVAAKWRNWQIIATVGYGF